MLRAAHKLIIETKAFYNNNDLMLSPIINLNGLILRSDNPIPEIITSFLNSKDIIVNRISIDDEYFVKLQGNFHITKFEIEQFIQQNKELVDSQLKDLDKVPVAKKLQESLANKYTEINNESNTSLYCNEKQVLSISSPTMVIGEELLVKSSKFRSRLGVAVSGQNSTFDVNKLKVTGEKLPFEDSNSKAGVLDTCLSLKNTTILFSKKALLKNSLMDAGETLTISSPEGLLELKLQKSIDWKNNPYASSNDESFKQPRSNVVKLKL